MEDEIMFQPVDEVWISSSTVNDFEFEKGKARGEVDRRESCESGRWDSGRRSGSGFQFVNEPVHLQRRADVKMECTGREVDLVWSRPSLKLRGLANTMDTWAPR